MEKTKENKITSAIKTAKNYWHNPPKGSYISYKEIAFLSGAGFGTHWTTLLATSIALSGSNFLVGACIGLKSTHLQYMLIIANLIGMPMGIFRSWYYDNHNLKGGKFLPFIQRTTVPIFLISTVMVWVPYENFSYMTKVVVVEIMYLLLHFFLSFYTESYTYFQQIISPDTQDRARALSISQVIYSLAPTLSGLLIPMLGRYDDIWTYRYIYPIFGIIGVVLNLVFFPKVKERLVLPKRKAEPVRMLDAVREVAKNKYYWIIQAASWVVFLESGYGVILGWQFVYSDGGVHHGTYGVASTIIGNAALWSMLLAPFAIKAMGKRNLLIVTNLFNAVVIFCLYFTYKNLILVCVLWYLNNFASTFWNIVQHNISADMRDYHQWKTGVRIDGLFGPLGLIGTAIGFVTGLFYPVIYESNGVLEDYSVLYDDAVRNALCEDLIVFSVIGAILNLIPFIFYDLSENKHRAYVDVLRIRKMFTDHSLGLLDDDELIGAMSVIREARELIGKEKTAVDTSILKEAKRLPRSTDTEKEIRSEAIKRAKAEIREAKERNLAIERAPIIVADLEKFTTRAGKLRVESAGKTFAEGCLCRYENTRDELKKAKRLPKKTKEEKEIRSDAVKLARARKEAAHLIDKYGKDNLNKPNEEEKNEILERETANFLQALSVRREIRKYMKKESLYLRATKPYRDAGQLIEESRNYTHFEELEARYGELIKENV